MLPNWFPTSMLLHWRSLAHSQVSTDFPVVSLVSHFFLVHTFYDFLQVFSIPFPIYCKVISTSSPAISLTTSFPFSCQSTSGSSDQGLTDLSACSPSTAPISRILRKRSPCTKHPMAFADISVYPVITLRVLRMRRISSRMPSRLAAMVFTAATIPPSFSDSEPDLSVSSTASLDLTC